MKPKKPKEQGRIVALGGCPLVNFWGHYNKMTGWRLRVVNEFLAKVEHMRRRPRE